MSAWCKDLLRKGWVILLLGAASFALLLSPATTAQAANDPPILRQLAGTPEYDRVATLIQAAREEGSLTVYGNALKVETFNELARRFKELYGLHDVNLNFSRIKMPELEMRIEEEVRTGRPTVDVVHMGGMDWLYSMLDRGELLEYHSPEYAHYTVARRVGMVEPGYWAADMYVFAITYNPLLIDEEIDDWDDLLNPEYAGKISIHDVARVATYAMDYIGLRKVLGLEFFQELAKLDPIVVSTNDAKAQLVAQGERPISTSVSPGNAEPLITAGAPVKLVFPKSGQTAIPLTFAILKRTQHPNMAKLWIDFTHRPEGQEVLIRRDHQISGREGMPTPELLPPFEELNLIALDFRAELSPENLERIRSEWRAIFNK